MDCSWGDGGEDSLSVATSIRNTVRNIITDLGSDATLYPFSSATKSYNEEGDVTVSSWSSNSSIKVIGSNHYAVRRLLKNQGEENNDSERVVILRDDVTIAHRDKLTISTDVYLVNEVKKIDPIENTLIAQRCVLVRDALYV